MSAILVHPPVGQLWRYGVVGVLNTGTGLAIIATLHVGLGLNLALSNATGYLCGWLLSYALNRGWTFRHSGSHRRSLPAWALLVLAAYALSLTLVAGAMRLGLPWLTAQGLGVLLYSTIVLFGARYVVFARR